VSEPDRRESPLAGLAGQPDPAHVPAVTLGERAFLGHVNLRGDPADAGFLEAVRGVLGLALPLAPDTFVARGRGKARREALWLGPDEWLVLTPPDAEGQTIGDLCAALAVQHAAVTDLSSGQTVFALAGARARDVLGKGCPLDLHPREFGTGRCAQSYIAKTNALVRQTGDAPAFEIVVRRSFAEYLWLWLRDAAEEYGFVVRSS